MVTTPRIPVLGALDVPGVPKAARRLLAVLTLRAGRLVRTDEAIDALWGEQPPATARKSLQNQVVRLRQQLGADAISTEPDGYRLLVPTDVPVFERLARTDPDAALAMWRGEPWLELEQWPPAAAERARLVELRLAAEESAAERRLDVADAQRLVDEQPLREQRWCILLRSLYAAGRQADALRAAQRARSMLRDELGLDPGPELRAIETAIARQDLDTGTPSNVAVSAADALRLGSEAHSRGDYLLAAQWLRIAGPRADARLALARAAFAAGDVAGGLDAVRDVIERAAADADAATALEALMALVASRGPSVTIPAVTHLFDVVDRLAASFDDEQRLVLASCRVLAHAYSLGREELAPLIAEATAATDVVSPRTAVLMQLAELIALDRPHDAERRLDLAASMTRSGDPELDRCASALRRHAVLWSHLELGDPRHRDARDQLVAAAATSRHAVERAGAAVWATCGILDGDLTAAERDAVEWIGPLAASEGPGLATTVHPASLFPVRWMQGRLPELIPALEAAAAAMPETLTWRSALAMAYADAGRLADANDLLQAFVDGGLRVDVVYGLWSATMFHLVNAAAAVHDATAIELLGEALAPIADRHAFYVGHHLGSFHHHLGLLQAAAGDERNARKSFAAGIEMHEKIGSRWWTARSRRWLASLG